MVTMEKTCSIIHGLKPTLLMVLVQTTFAGVNILYKLAANDGMNLRVLVAYRFLFGAAFISPVAFFVERKKRPKLTWTVAFYALLCGLLGGALGQNLYLQSLVLTSATFVSAMTNLIPAMTFIVAVSLRLERLGWHSPAGKAKVLGTIMGIGGAMLLTFYKGPEINIWKTDINLLRTTQHQGAPTGKTTEGGNLLLGSLLALAACVCYSLWLILQAKAAERYPCSYSFTALMTWMASIQGVTFALCTERDWNQWKLGWNIRLFAVAFTGILGSGMIFTLVAWCVRMRGPLFVSVFNPLLLVLVAIAGSLFLEEKLHLGSVLGAILIVCGLYGVLWGKGKEIKRISQLMPAEDASCEDDDQANQVRISISSSAQDHEVISDGSIHRKEEKEEDQRRNSHASSEIVGGLYMYA